MTYKIAVFSSSRGTVLQAIMDELKAGEMPGVELTGVFSNRKACGAIERAQESGFPTYTFAAKGKTREEYDAEVLTALSDLNVDLIVLVGYMRILSSDFVSAYEKRIINVHPSLLPEFAGGMDANVHQDVLDAGVKETGMTIHLVDESVDGGQILMQKSCAVAEGETVETLKSKVQALECQWMPEIIRQFADGRIQESIE